MVTVNEELIRGVVEQVVAQLAVGNANGAAPNAPASFRRSGAGIFPTVDDAVGAAREAFEVFSHATIDERRRAIKHIREICISGCERLGRMEMEETRIGRLDHKIEKLVIAGERTPGVEYLQTHALTGDSGLTLNEHAPFGVIGAITPATHSLPTLASNAISMLAAGNTVVFNAHPRGANIAKEGVKVFNEAIRAEIGIDNLVTIVDPPTIESAQQIFDHRDVRLLVVTGGPAVARAALRSPKRAIVAGPGNPPVVVDQTADIEQAAQSIVAGASYDNNLLCIGEKEVFAVHEIFETLLAAMTGAGGYRLSDAQIHQLEAAAFKTNDDGKVVVHPDFVGKDAAVLAQAIGVNVPAGTQLLFGETGEHSPFVDHEQMMPFVPFVRVPCVDTAMALAKKYEHGYRHTAIIHSRDLATITKMSRMMEATVFVANGPSPAGIGVGGEGVVSFSIATPTGEGVTTPLTFTRRRRAAIVNSLRLI
ncbi:Succinate-semialdehyde dehydrogenase (acetylating) [Planctomycetes bacterium Pan216]|uniref:Succinate-semialdehyde dehydrogenase (Acetylating) n=1 Tax=Kolteria novifilia TaxID=2527975 RepID=A0A518B9M3_9BACT|nr:Succinate-semialdehyde dehydrogenase (acetylating) [Planctomycetes bacterium Pan216]